MKKTGEPESACSGTDTAIPQLIFELSEALRRANVALLGLTSHEAFAHQKAILREDAEQLREARGDMLDYILETWRCVETDAADELRVTRKVREKLERDADEVSLA